ncbi:hypothetical protein NC651_009269 [Populus alba x Populus x berolinensis]|nr:hypothetical protein NC651_009269 [Populus alba x Populus x berolinensis]
MQIRDKSASINKESCLLHYHSTNQADLAPFQEQQIDQIQLHYVLLSWFHQQQRSFLSAIDSWILRLIFSRRRLSCSGRPLILRSMCARQLQVGLGAVMVRFKKALRLGKIQSHHNCRKANSHRGGIWF